MKDLRIVAYPSNVSFFVRKTVKVASLFFILLLAIMADYAHSAVVHSSSTSLSSSSTNVSFNFTASSNTNRILVFTVALLSDSEATAITSVTFAGRPFIRVIRQKRTGIAAEMWYLLNPPSGTGSVNVRQSSGSVKAMGVSEYHGVEDIGAFSGVSVFGNSISNVLTTTRANSRIVGICTQRNTWGSITFTPVTTGLTTRWNRQASSWPTNIRGLYHDIAAATQRGYTLSYSSNRSNESVLVNMELRAASPRVISCTPSVGHTAGGQQVTITGANFDNGCTVSFGGAAAPAVVYVNRNTLTVTVPPNSPGTVNITVRNPNGQSGVGTGLYTYSAFMAPVISSVTPATGSTLGGQDITISGSNFMNGCVVAIGGVAPSSLVFINSSTLTMKTPPHSAGVADVRVTNPDTQSSVLAGGYRYVMPPPLPEYCVPASGLSAGGQEITVKGRNFVNGSTVTIGGVNAGGLVFVDTMTIRVTAPPNPAGPANVAVRNPDAQTGTLTGGYTYYDLPAPVIGAVHPASGSTAGGQSITVSGMNFVSGCTADIGGINAPVIFINSSMIVLLTPPHTAGVKAVSVRNPDTQSFILENGYTYAAPPVITLCSPSVGTVTGGRIVTVTGQNFRAGCSLFIGGIPVAVTRVSSTQLVFTSPPHAEGSVDIRVENTNFTQGVLVAGYFYDGTSPVIALNGGGSDVTIAAGSAYVEEATAIDNYDGNITGGILRAIHNASGATVTAVSTSAIQVFTIRYNVSDSSGNPANERTRIVRVTDQTPPVIMLNGGGADVTILTGTAYAEAATAFDNIDGNITGLIVREIRDSGNNIVASVSTGAEETYTITYNATDLSMNAALQQTRVVRIVDREITGITIISPPGKVKYKTGEPINTAGLTVLATYDDMSSSLAAISALNLSGFDSSAPQAGQVITVALSGFSDTFSVDIIGLASISVAATPVKTVYDINEPFEISGLSVTGTYTDSSSEPLTVTPANITGFDSSSPAALRRITVTYAGLEAYFNVSIVPTLSMISVTSPPLKTLYDIDEPFDITGLAVTGYYTDGSQQLLPVNAGHIAGFDSSSVDDEQILTVAYGGRQAFFGIKIITTLASIAITTPPFKTVFNTGDAFVMDGMVVTGTYTDGSKKIETVTMADVAGFDSSVPVTGQVITVTVNGKTATYLVYIVQPQLVSIAVTNPPDKLSYSIGEDLDITGLVVTGTYDDASTKVMPVTEGHISGFNSSVPDASQVLTIFYGGKTASYTVVILEHGPFVSDCSPDTGPSSGGTAITIYGDNFKPGCTVMIGGAPAVSVVFIDENTITAVTPARSGGYADIIVTNPDGQSGTAQAIFFYSGPTATPSRTSVFTHTPTRTASLTQTITGTPTISRTQTVSPTVTVTFTATPTRTITQTFTHTPTVTVTPTITMTATSTPGYGNIESGKTRVFPQPASDTMKIEYGLAEAAEVSLIIFNAGAIKVSEKNRIQALPGSNIEVINVTRYAPGVYYYVIRARNASGKETVFPVNKFLVAR